jgi:hypothetical protein
MGRERVLDREVVQGKLFLHLAKQRLVRLEKADPHERVGSFNDVADVVKRYFADTPPV